MKSPQRLKHSFVEGFPDQLEKDVLYVSVEHATMAHLCACGCGAEVVTPLNPTDWRFTFDGKSISVQPSIGNWSLPCRSHYIIRHNLIHWAEDWSEERIAAGRKIDLARKRAVEPDKHRVLDHTHQSETTNMSHNRRGFISRLRNFFLADR